LSLKNGLILKKIVLLACFVIVTVLLPSNIASQQLINLQRWERVVNNKAPEIIDISKEDPLFYERGFATYQTDFTVPLQLKENQLAFYTDLIDDADKFYINGHLIGSTGRMPVSLEKVTGYNFRSASRMPRLYLIPDRFLNKTGINHVIMQVFNYAGYGGFVKGQHIAIGNYKGLFDRYQQRLLYNDAPRVFAIGILFLLIILHTNTLKKCSVKHIRAITIYVWHSLFPFFGKNEINTSSETILLYKNLTNLLFAFCIGFYIFSEVSFKYLFIKNEFFWFKAPAFAFLSCSSAFLLMNYCELFSKVNTVDNRIGRFTLQFLSILTHPVIYFPVSAYVLLVPPYRAWDTATTITMYWIIFLLILFMLFSLFILGGIIINKGFGHSTDIHKKEFIIRLLFISVIMFSLVCFVFHVRPFADLVSVLFCLPFVLYAAIVSNFYRKHGTVLAFGMGKKTITKEAREKVQQAIDFLHTKYDDPGLNRTKVANAVHMSKGYLSTNFKAITNKSITEFIRKLRVEEAKRLLSDPEAQVCRVMEKVGFKSLRDIDNAFRNETGQLPSEFQAEIKKKMYTSKS
jgi:AraC-like DNA-binding protein